MSFGGPPPSTSPPSGPFEEMVTKVASSPYMIAAAIFLINIGGRFLPFEISKGQEKFLNAPWFRRCIIFVIFFIATRNLIIAAWLSIVMILCIGYLFNENSSLYIFGKGSPNRTVPSEGDKYALTSEEQAILKSLQDKAAKSKPLGTNASEPTVLANRANEIYNQYTNTLKKLM